MATYELYMGGPRQQNSDWAIFPAAPFSANNPAALGPANKTPVVFGAERTLDFGGNDVALSYFLNTTLDGTGIVTGDILGGQVVPSQSLFIGCWWSVNVPTTSLTFALEFRAAAATILTTTSAGTATSGWAVYPSTGTHYFATPDILDVNMVSVPAGGVGSLSLTITPVYYNFQVGQN